LSANQRMGKYVVARFLKALPLVVRLFFYPILNPLAQMILVR
jgi:hypothetical protein